MSDADEVFQILETQLPPSISKDDLSEMSDHVRGLGKHARVEDVVKILRGHLPAEGVDFIMENSDLDGLLRELGRRSGGGGPEPSELPEEGTQPSRGGSDE
jgi:hypothetical protein